MRDHQNPANNEVEVVWTREADAGTFTNNVFVKKLIYGNYNSSTKIKVDYVRPTTTATCIHDTTSTFATAVTPTTMIVDCSTEFDSDVREIPFTSITSLIVQSE